MGMDVLAGSDDTEVLTKGPAKPEVERLSPRVGDDTARFFDQDCARCVVLDGPVSTQRF